MIEQRFRIKILPRNWKTLRKNSIRFLGFFLYSQLDDKINDIMVSPRTEQKVIQVAAACAKHRLHVTIRSGATGNYGNACRWTAA